MLYRNRFYLAPDGGAGGGGSPEPKPNNEETVDEQLKKLQEEIEVLREEKAERIRLDEEEKLKKMSDEEKLKASMDALLEDHRVLQLKGLGLPDEYISLFAGTTPEEIKKSGELVDRLIRKISADTEARVKKEVVRTPAPGAGVIGDKMSDEEYYKAALKGEI